jgi:hypothetical protein
MRSRRRRARAAALAGLSGAVVLASAGIAGRANAASLTLLTKTNWEALAPKGKEADAIYGDFVLRNDRVTAVVAFPGPRRHANFATLGVGGALIDLEARDAPSDQLTAFYPGGGGCTFEFAWASAGASAAALGQRRGLDAARGGGLAGGAVSLAFVAHPEGHAPEVTVVYTLGDGEPYVEVATTFTNFDDQPIEVAPVDRVRVDTNVDPAAIDRAADGESGLYWVYDRWFGQAYGVVPDGAMWVARDTASWRTPTVLSYGAKVGDKRRVAKGEPLRIRRRVIAGRDLFAVRETANVLAKIPQRRVRLAVVEATGAPGAGAGRQVPTADADVEIQIRDQLYGLGRTDAHGVLSFTLPGDEDAVAIASATGQRERRILLAGEATRFQVALEAPGWVEIDVREGGVPVPCKVQIFGRAGTRDPSFGPDHLESWLGNLVYAVGGGERHKLGPGRYDAIVSHGPEYDAVFTSFEVTPGAVTTLRAELKRSVDTTGWISADFHNHSTESGDNITSQRGRVRALLAEHLEFAPCTEHNRISSYLPHLQALKAGARMATASGIELTGSSLTINHQNAFPLVMRPHLQDNGGPEPSADMDLQIERLALWDDGSDKLVQENHPSLAELFFDVDRDEYVDPGHRLAVGLIDVVEIHPPEAIFWAPFSDEYPPWVVAGAPYENRVLSWLQILNRGRRLPAVVNTDAHGNFHETGLVRNFVHSPTDDPARVKTLDVVHEAEKGHVVVSNGPFLEVTLKAPGDAGAGALPGDEIKLPGGKGVLHVRVQTANWLDVDRVRVVVNGRFDRTLDLSRGKQPEAFGAGPVKFERDLPLALKADAHVIVAVIGEHGHLGPVAGPDHAADRPVAFSNPIFVDVDGDGWKPSGDLLGQPLLPPKKRVRPGRP